MAERRNVPPGGQQVTFLLIYHSGRAEPDSLYGASLLWLFELNLWRFRLQLYPCQYRRWARFAFTADKDRKIVFKAIKTVFPPDGFTNRRCDCPLLPGSSLMRMSLAVADRNHHLSPTASFHALRLMRFGPVDAILKKFSIGLCGANSFVSW